MIPLSRGRASGLVFDARSRRNYYDFGRSRSPQEKLRISSGSLLRLLLRQTQFFECKATLGRPADSEERVMKDPRSTPSFELSTTSSGASCTISGSRTSALRRSGRVRRFSLENMITLDRKINLPIPGIVGLWIFFEFTILCCSFQIVPEAPLLASHLIR